jgi:putative membrane protein
VSSDAIPWRRLDSRVVWVDAVRILLSLLPGFIVMTVFQLRFDSFALWAVLVTTGLGVINAAEDLFRWLKTRYRITDERVEQRTGWLVRKYRFVPRDRVRSVDTTARLRHRLAGLRVVTIGTGEQAPSFALDAVSRRDAEVLRRELIDRTAGHAEDTTGHPGTVLARLRWSWIAYNLVNAWAFLVALFLLWGAYWGLQVVGVDLRRVILGLVDWQALGTGWTVAIAVGGVFLLGVGGLAANFVTENWDFRLARTTTADGGTALHTRQGLFNARDVYRDEARIRGVHLAEPLFWRWMGASELEVISTGLARWSVSKEPASKVLPRGPVGEAHRVAALVLADGLDPLRAPLRRHPPAALVRRLFWAVLIPVFAAAMCAWYGVTGALPAGAWLVPLAALPVTAGLAVVAYRSLGHGAVGPYLVLRCGLWSRSTAALQGRAVIGWTVRQSIVQRLLGLTTITVATAAGYKFYQAPDVGADEALRFVDEVTPGLLTEFLVEPPTR